MVELKVYYNIRKIHIVRRVHRVHLRHVIKTKKRISLRVNMRTRICWYNSFIVLIRCIWLYNIIYGRKICIFLEIVIVLGVYSCKGVIFAYKLAFKNIVLIWQLNGSEFNNLKSVMLSSLHTPWYIKVIFKKLSEVYSAMNWNVGVYLFKWNS